MKNFVGLLAQYDPSGMKSGTFSFFSCIILLIVIGSVCFFLKFKSSSAPNNSKLFHTPSKNSNENIDIEKIIVACEKVSSLRKKINSVYDSYKKV